MKKAMLILFLVIIVLGGVVYVSSAFGKTTFQQKIGDIAPALLPPSTSQPAPDVKGQSADSRLKIPSGYQVTLFSTQTPTARDLQFSPDGTLLVSLKGQGKVIALPDQDKDGRADKVVEVIRGLKNPHGLAFYNGKLFVAEEQQVSRYSWNEQSFKATLEKKLFDGSTTEKTMPAGGSGHVTRSLVFDKAGNLYISVGSTCNVCEEKHPYNGAVVITDSDGNNPRLFSKGLRNAVFLATHPETNKIWVTDMGRDFLGDNLPPDEVDILQDNGDFGWPFCYGDQVYDRDFGKQSAEYCRSTIKPIFKIQAHSAPLGLEFIQSSQFPEDWQGDLLVAYHGSWNRSEPTGYKVVRLNVEGETITGQEDFMTGFLQGRQTIGRPVDMIFDSQGSLYISDDKAGAVYLISKTSP